MDLDSVKWLLAIPGSIAATISLPLLIRKQILECKKLDLEISEKEISLSDSGLTYKSIQKRRQEDNLKVMRWFASSGVTWQMIIIVNALGFGYLFGSYMVFSVGAGLSLVLGLIVVYCGVELPKKEVLAALGDLHDIVERIEDSS